MNVQSRLTIFPLELMNAIFDNLLDDRRGMAAFSCVCHHWAQVARPFRFRHTRVTVSTGDVGDKLGDFIRFLQSSSAVARCIRRLTIRGLDVSWRGHPEVKVAPLVGILTLLHTHQLSTLVLSSVNLATGKRWGTDTKFRLAELRLEDWDGRATRTDDVLKVLRIFDEIDVLRLGSLENFSAVTDGLLTFPVSYGTKVHALKCKDVAIPVVGFFLKCCPVLSLTTLETGCKSIEDAATLARSLEAHTTTISNFTIDISTMTQYRTGGVGTWLPFLLEPSVDSLTAPELIAQALRLSQCTGLQSLRIVLTLSLRVNQNDNAKAWDVLTALVRSAPAALPSVTVEFVISGLLDVVATLLSWDAFNRALDALPALQVVTFVNRKWAFTESEERLIKKYLRSPTRRVALELRFGRGKPDDT